MDLTEPTPRYRTKKATIAIIEKLKWPYKEWMQDWPLEVSDRIDIAICLQAYPELIDDDEKFLLMQGILYALEEIKISDLQLYKNKVIAFLKSDFDIHKFTIYYWTLYSSNYKAGVEDGFSITPLMRDIWNSQSIN